MRKHNTKVYILPLIAELERRTGNRRSDSEYAKLIGISRQAFNALVEGKTGGATNLTINKLLDFFASQDMQLTPGAFYITEVTDT
jgi:hypothetical protein